MVDETSSEEEEVSKFAGPPDRPGDAGKRVEHATSTSPPQGFSRESARPGLEKARSANACGSSDTSESEGREELGEGARPRTALPASSNPGRGGRKVLQSTSHSAPAGPRSHTVCPITGPRASTPDTEYHGLPSRLHYDPRSYTGGNPKVAAGETQALEVL